MDIERLKQEIEIANMLKKENSSDWALGSSVIVRARDAGVLYGRYAGSDGSTIHLTDARQMWRWCAAKGIVLIDVAQHGVVAEKCKFSPASAKTTVFNACALIECSPEAAASIEAA